MEGTKESSFERAALDGVQPSERAVLVRPARGQSLAATEAMFGGALYDALKLVDADVTSVLSRDGEVVFVRAERDVLGVLPARGVALGRLLWEHLAGKPGDPVHVAVVGGLRPAADVTLSTAAQLTETQVQRVTAALQDNRSVVWSGAPLFSFIFSGERGVRLTVRDCADTPSVVTPDTKVRYRVAEPDPTPRKVSFADVGGLHGVTDRLRLAIELPLLRPGIYRSLGIRPPKGVLLHGPPGAGKSLLCKAVAADLGARAVVLSAPEIVGTYAGETEATLRSLFAEAAHHAPTLLIIDELDVIAGDRSKLSSQADIRTVSQLVTLMDGLQEVDGVVVLATTNRLDAIDEALRRPGRFDEEVFVGAPSVQERVEIMHIHTREMPFTDEGDEALTQVVEQLTPGFTGADLMQLGRAVGLHAARRITRGATGFAVAEKLGGQAILIEAADVWGGFSQSQPSSRRKLPGVRVDVKWDDIVGLDTVRERLLGHALKQFDDSGDESSEGVLLTGPTGNGKSVLVAALAEHLGANLVLVDGTSVFTQWLGESEASVRALFQRAHGLAPAIVVLEHLDALAPRRESERGDTASRRVLSALLSAIDEASARPGVLVVGVTNRPDLVDPAVSRSGRLGLHLDIPNPDESRRRALACACLPPDSTEALVEEFISLTAGANASEVTRRARLVKSQAP